MPVNAAHDENAALEAAIEAHRATAAARRSSYIARETARRLEQQQKQDEPEDGRRTIHQSVLQNNQEISIAGFHRLSCHEWVRIPRLTRSQS